VDEAPKFILWKCGGPYYRTRDGRRAVVLESNIVLSTGQHIWQGRVGWAWCEWDAEGRHTGGDGALDLTGETLE
jgi:hypothetical protein